MAVVLALEWTKTTFPNGDLLLSGTSLLNEAVDTEYTAPFQVFGREKTGHRYVSMYVTSVVSGTNLDIGLMGSMTDESALARTNDGAKFTLLDAPVVDVTTGTLKAGVVDFALYPAPFYYISILNDADEKANTVTVKIYIPAV